jgi:hypothetical protein
MAERKLRAVAPSERRSRKPKSVLQAIADSDRAVFVAMQERIAKAIDDPNIRGADLAALTRRLHELRKEISAIDARDLQEGESGPTADEDWSAV